MTSLLLLAALNLGAPSQARNVTFSCRAEPVSLLVRQLGVAAGLDLQASPAVAGDIMIVSVADKPIRDVMARIARADGAEWRESGGIYRLDASVRARRDEARDESARRIRDFEAVIDKQLAAVQKAVSTPNQSTPQHTATVSVGTGGGSGVSLQNNSPEALAVLRILKGIAPDDLAVKSGERVVYSTNPNAMQLPLGAGVGSEIQTLIESHNKDVAKYSAAKVGEQTAQMPDFVKKMIDRMGKPISGYAKADLVLSRMPYVSMLEATLVLYDNTGEAVLTTPQIINAGELENILAPKPAAKNDTPIPLSDATKAFTGLFATMRGGGMGKGIVLTPALKPYVLSPETHDPLALLPSDELLAVAEKRKEPLVAVIPDEAVSLFSNLMGAPPTVESVEADLKAQKVMRQLDDPGWLTIQPAFPEDARETRTDRAALGNLMRAVGAKGIPSLDDIADFSLSAPSPSTPGISQLYVSTFASAALGQGLDGLASWELFRIYALLPMPMKAAIASGEDQSIPLNGLTQAQLAQLRKMVYGPLPQLRVDKGNGKPTDFITQMINSATGGQDYTDEPTEVLPNGLPMNGVLKITSSKEPLLCPTPAAGPDTVPQAMGLDEIAMLKYFSTTPAFAQIAGQIPKFNSFRVGSRKVYSFKFEFAPKISASGNLKDSTLAANAPMVAADDLPSDVQAAIQKRVDAFKSSPLASIGALMGAQKAHP